MMRKDMLTFVLGLTAGAVLGILVSDEDKKIVQENLNDQIENLKAKYEELNQEGTALVNQGLNKAKTLKKEYLG